ncbi:MAG: DNA polymerase III subunit alpha [Candidatus Carsonella ruddii]
MNNFTHVNIHTEYTFIDSIIKTNQIIHLYKERKIKSLCITDIFSVSSFYEYYFYCYDNNIKALIGSECFFIHNGNIFGCLIIAKTYIGYMNLMNILSHSWRYGNLDNGVFIKINWIEYYKNDLIIILNIRNYFLKDFYINEEEFNYIIKHFLYNFENNFYLEINKINLSFEDYINEKNFFYSNKFKILLIATNSVKFLFKHDFTPSIGKILLNQELTKNSELFFEYSDQQYLKKYNNFKNVFLKEKYCIKNIKLIIEDCNLNFKCYGFDLPKIKINNFKIRKKIFINLLKKGIKTRIGKKQYNYINYINRINKELVLIKKLGIIDYFLIIFEFIFWSKKNLIPSGPGRGSGASSLACYILYVTDIDPLNENLLFERFFTFERINMPDLDLDFCVLERDLLLEHMFEYYNYSQTSQIITFHNLSVKTLIRDLSRAIGLDYLSGDRFSKSIPFSLTLSMEEIFKKNLAVRSYVSSNEKSLDIWKISTKIEGVYSSFSKHAGGVVISKHKIANSCAILFDEEDCITQYEKNFTQEIGLLKFDFLGLKTISIINFTFFLIPEKNTGEFNIDDFHTYQMLNNLDTELVFQLESFGMKKMIKRAPINNIYDIINYLSLFRPGPIQSGCLNIFLNRKNNLTKTYYPYENDNFNILKIFLSYTHGIVIYQEQIILIIHSFFQCTIYDSEKIFNIMIKGNIEELKKINKIFNKKVYNLNLSEFKSNKLFYLIVMFAEYSFNRTHAHSYAKIVYQTAFLKANYLLEYSLSNIYVDQLLNIDLDRIIFNLKIVGVNFYKPDINISDENFKIYKNGILYGFSLIKFIDEQFIDRILYYRNKIFFYNNFDIFCKIFSIFNIKNRKLIENLIFCGFFDCFKKSRIFLYINFQFIYEKIILLKKEYNRSLIYKMLIFNDYTKVISIKNRMIYISCLEVLNIEKKILKFFISNIPSDYYFNKYYGHKYFKKINKKINENFLIIITTPKKKFFFEKKKNIFRIIYNEKILVLKRYSIFISLPNIEVPFVLILLFNKKKYMNEVIKCFYVKSFNLSSGLIYIIVINNFNLFHNLIIFFFNKFNFTGSNILIKYKKKIFKTKICLFFYEEILFNLKILKIKKFYSYTVCK